MTARVLSVVFTVLLVLTPSGAGLAAAAPEPIFGTATGDTDEPGSLTPTGHGRFVIQDRVYAGRSLGRSVVDEWAACFSGALTSSEEWSLEAPKMVGSHQSTVVIRSERGQVTLRLRGQMESLVASGGWEIVRTSGSCAGLEGAGRYTAKFSSGSPEFRLTFEGQVGA